MRDNPGLYMSVQFTEAYDVVVVGGGTTGLVAALAAARNGAKTALVEYNSFIGGNAANGIPFLGFHNKQKQLVVKGLALELVKRLQGMGAATNFYFDPITSDVVWISPDWLKIVAMKMLTESGVHIYLRSLACAVERDGQQVKAIYIANKQGCQRLACTTVIDATDTADVAVQAGAGYARGRASDGKVQVASYVIRVEGINYDDLLAYYNQHPDQIRPFPLSQETLAVLVKQMNSKAPFVIGGLTNLVARAVSDGLDFPRDRMVGVCNPQWGEAAFVTSRVEDVDPNDVHKYSSAEQTGQLQVFAIMDFIRRYMPGGSDARLIGTGHQIGIRETRHITGDYTLTVDDLLRGERPSDTIGLGAYHIDIHTPDHKGMGSFSQPPTYGIPYRSLLPQRISNVLVAGRCISATHEAQASTRVMPICMGIGQAAGAAAALAVKTSRALREIDVAGLRSALIEQGAELGQGL